MKLYHFLFTLIIGFAPALAAKKVGVLFSHGLADTGEQAYNYSKEYSIGGINYCYDRYILQEPITTFNYPDSIGIVADIFRVNFTQTDLGQYYEIQSLQKAYERACATSEELIVFGLSRGASAVIDWLPSAYRPNIKAVILESPFHSFIGILTEKCPYEWLQKIVEYVVGNGFPFFKYRLDGLHPINTIAQFPPEIPLLLVCSNQDFIVPPESTIKLAQELKKTGHRNLYLLRLNGSHSRILSGPDGHIYQKTVHAFYKKYNLPYDPVLAEQGKEFLDQAAL